MDTFHLLRGWLKEVASSNIKLILVTLDTFQLLSGSSEGSYCAA